MPHINKPILSIILSFVILCIASSCGDSKRKAYEEAVIEWTGKEILFPDSMRLVGGGMIAKPEADFTIVSYYDSVGCTGCRMKLRFWNEFMQRVDSVRGDKTVQLLLIAATKDEEELKYLKQRDYFNSDIVFDPNDIINQINHFPKDIRFQTFLINRENKVLTFGNPTDKISVARVYIDCIKGVESECSDEPQYSHNFGDIEAGTSVSHIFNIPNNYADTLKIREIISSCECTEGTVSKTFIPPGASFDATVTFADTIGGSFYRTIKIYFKEQKPEIVIEIKGNVITKN